MTSDATKLVERLRFDAERDGVTTNVHHNLLEAADIIEAQQRKIETLRSGLEYGIGAAKNELVSRGLPLEWSKNSGIGVMTAALSSTEPQVK